MSLCLTDGYIPTRDPKGKKQPVAVYSVLPLDPLMRDEVSKPTEITTSVGPAGAGNEGGAAAAQGAGPERPILGREAEAELIMSQVSRLIPRSGGRRGPGGTIFIEGNTGEYWLMSGNKPPEYYKP